MPIPILAAPAIPGVASAAALAAVGAAISYLAAQGRVPKVPLDTLQEKLDWINEQYLEIQQAALDDLQVFGALGTGLLNNLTGASSPSQSQSPTNIKAKSAPPQIYREPKPLFNFSNPFNQLPGISPIANPTKLVPPPVVPPRRLPPTSGGSTSSNPSRLPQKVQTSQQGSTKRVYGQLSYAPIDTNRVHENIIQDTRKFEADFQKSQIQSLKQFQDWAKGADVPFINTGLTFIDKPGVGEIPVWGTGISELMNQLDGGSRVKVQTPTGTIPGSSINTPLVVGGLGALGVGAAAVAASPAARVRAANTLSRMNRGITSLRASVDLSWILSVMTFASTMHNAALLSTDIINSLIASFDNVFKILNVKGVDGQPLEMKKLLGQTIKDNLVKMLGADQVANIKAKWLKYSAIYRAGSAVMGTLARIQQNTLSVIEVTGSYVGRIGNALRRYGAVGEDAYSWMSEAIAARSVRYESLNNSLENVSHVASDLETMSSAGVDTKDAFGQLKTDKDLVYKTVEEASPDKGAENEKVKAEEDALDKASIPAEIKPEDE